MNFFIKIGVPTWKEAKYWGDFHFAAAICKVLRERGHDCRIQVLNEWKSDKDKQSDVTIHLKGLSRYSPKQGCLNVLWIISHPEKIKRRELKKYDLILVASRPFSETIASWVDIPVYPLLQFADTHVMYPDADPEFSCDLLFLGNSRKVNRQIISDLLPCSYDLHIWGSDWDSLVPEAYIKGRYFPYETARKLYSSATIVLNDHWPDMKKHGFINNRVFDALACNAFIISDDCVEIHRFFQRGLVSYVKKSELIERVDYFLIHAKEKKAIAQSGYNDVMQHHTVNQRVEELLSIIGQTTKQRKIEKRGSFFFFRK